MENGWAYSIKGKSGIDSVIFSGQKDLYTKSKHSSPISSLAIRKGSRNLPNQYNQYNTQQDPRFKPTNRVSPTNLINPQGSPREVEGAMIPVPQVAGKPGSILIGQGSSL